MRKTHFYFLHGPLVSPAAYALRRFIVNPSVTIEPKMSSPIASPSPESRTTLHLDPIFGPEAFAKYEWPIALTECRGLAVVMAPDIHAETIEIAGNVWQKDGTPVNTLIKLLAWRTWTGPWHVLDARVSTLLAQVDAEIEP